MAFNAGDIEAKLKLDRTPFQRELDKAIRQGREFDKMRFTATLDADKRPFTKAINQARAAGVRFGATKYDTKLGADRSALRRALKGAAADVKQFTRQKGTASIGLDADEVDVETKRIKRLTHDAGIQVMNNFRSPWRRFKWPAIFAAVTAGAAAAPAALVGLGGAAGALAGAFVGPVKAFGAYADAAKAVASGSDDAAEKMGAFRSQMSAMTPEAQKFVTQTLNMSEVWNKFSRAMQQETLPGFTTFMKGLEDAAPSLTRGMGAVGAAVSQLVGEFGELFKSPVFQGHLERAFKNSVPVVRSLGKFVTNLFRDITLLVSKTESMSVGLANMVDGLGRGFTGFFRELTPFSDTMGRSFAALGDIVGDLFTALGRFSGILSTGLAPGLEVLRDVLDRTYTVVNNFVAGALPGFTTAWSAAGAVLGAFATALAPIAGLLGSVAGTLAPFALALKAIDMITFGKIAGQFSVLKGNVGAASGVAGKAKTAFRSLATMGLGPLGLAAIALGGFLTILGNRQREAAEKAAFHKERVKDLTQALIEDEGAMGRASRASVVKSLTDQEALKHATNFGYSLDLVTSAAMGNEGALNTVNEAMNRRRAAIEDAIRKNGHNRDSNRKVTEALTTQRDALQMTQDAINAEAAAVKEAERAAYELQAAQEGVTVSTLKAMNATISLNSALVAGVEANLSYREAAHRVKTATEAAAEALKENGKRSDEYKEAVFAQERAILQQLEAKKKDTIETHKAAGETKAAEKGVLAYNREALKLAGTLTGPMPPALRKIIEGMSETDAKAAGAKVETNKLGEAVVRLPNGKTIKLNADTGEASIRLQNLRSQLAGIRDKTITVGVNTVTGKIDRAGMGGFQRAKGSIDKFVDGFAQGGMTFNGRRVKPMAAGFANIVPPGTPRLLGDNKAVRESFIPHDRSPRSKGLLKETNRLMGDPLGIGVGVNVAPQLRTVEIARAVSGAITAAMSNMGVEITIGGERIQEIAEVAVTRHNRAMVRGVKAGAGRNR